MAFSANRRRDFGRVERFRLVLAYARGDRQAARRIWRALGRRPRWMHRAMKQLACGILGRLLAGSPPGRTMHGI